MIKQVVLSLLVFLSISTFTYGDGKFYADYTVKKTPNIPTQRAILKYLYGKETLIIESKLDGQGENFGWVIPLPAKPDKLDIVQPGLIELFSLNIGPKVHHDFDEKLLRTFFLVIPITCLCLTILFLKHRKRLRLVLLLFIGFLTFIFASLAMPTLGLYTTAGISNDPTNNSLSVTTQTIGNYDVSILEASDSQALDQWLKENHFQGLTDKEKIIIDDYINKGWCFVTSKLHRHDDQPATPHPIAIEFQSDTAIYPMRLTGMTNAPVYLELYVIAMDQASTPHLTIEFSDNFTESIESQFNMNRYSSNAFSEKLYRSDSQQLLWDGCRITKLCNTVSPENMAHDYIIDFNKKPGYQKHYYSSQGALQSSSIIGLTTWWVGMIVISLLYNNEKHKDKDFKYFRNIFLLPLFLISLAFGSAALVSYDIVDVEVKSKYHPRYVSMLDFRNKRILFDEISSSIANYQDMTDIELKNLYDHFFKMANFENPYLPTKLERNSLPGNFDFTYDDGKITSICFYSQNGYPKYYSSFAIQDNTRRKNAIKDAYTFLTSEAKPGNQGLIDYFNAEPGYFSELDRYPVLVDFYINQPKEIIPNTLQVLKYYLKNKPDKVKSLRYITSVLGCTTHIEPPFNVRSQTLMNQYIQQIEQWHQQKIENDSAAITNTQ